MDKANNNKNTIPTLFMDDLPNTEEEQVFKAIIMQPSKQPKFAPPNQNQAQRQPVQIGDIDISADLMKIPDWEEFYSSCRMKLVESKFLENGPAKNQAELVDPYFGFPVPCTTEGSYMPLNYKAVIPRKLGWIGISNNQLPDTVTSMNTLLEYCHIAACTMLSDGQMVQKVNIAKSSATSQPAISVYRMLKNGKSELLKTTTHSFRAMFLSTPHEIYLYVSPVAELATYEYIGKVVEQIRRIIEELQVTEADAPLDEDLDNFAVTVIGDIAVIAYVNGCLELVTACEIYTTDADRKIERQHSDFLGQSTKAEIKDNLLCSNCGEVARIKEQNDKELETKVQTVVETLTTGFQRQLEDDLSVLLAQGNLPMIQSDYAAYIQQAVKDVQRQAYQHPEIKLELARVNKVSKSGTETLITCKCCGAYFNNAISQKLVSHGAMEKHVATEGWFNDED